MEQVSFPQFLLRRLKEAGCDDMFCVPGDFVLGFLNQVLKSPINYVGTCNELNAAYAADAYARNKGIGVLAITYAVGELSAINGVAGSFAEHVPVVCIGGIPATKFFRYEPLLHHTLGDYMVPYKMYSKITVAQTMLDNPATAAQEVDRVLTACLEQKGPVYIGLHADMVFQTIEAPVAPFKRPAERVSDPGSLEESVLDALRLLHQSRYPIFIPGVEIMRRGLKEDFESLLDASGVPFATMMLSKCIVNEDHKQFIGIYSGKQSAQYVRERVEMSDCLIILGEKLTDFNTGGFSANMDRRSTIEVFYDRVQIMFHTYQNVYIHDFMRELIKRINFRDPENFSIVPAISEAPPCGRGSFANEPNKPLSIVRFFDRMSRFIAPNSVVIAETGASLFAAAEIFLPRDTKFIGQTFYGSIGYTVGACLGACIANKDSRRVYLFVGDGSFQVTCQDLSTMIRYGCKPVVFLMNNDGYTIERVIVDHPYNDLQQWKYYKMPEVFGGVEGTDCHTEGELEKALATANNFDRLYFIEVHTERFDCTETLKRAGRNMAINNRLLEGADGEQQKQPASTEAAVPKKDPYSVIYRGE